MKRILVFLKVMLTALLVMLLVKTFAFTSCSIPSTGMENTLYQGEKVLVNKWSYGLRIPFTSSHFMAERAQRGDVVLFNNPAPSNPESPVYARELFISRCVGIPGDTLMLNAELLVTGQKVLSPDSKQLYAYPSYRTDYRHDTRHQENDKSANYRYFHSKTRNPEDEQINTKCLQSYPLG